MKSLVAPHKHVGGIGGALQGRRQLDEWRAWLEQPGRNAKELCRLGVRQYYDVIGVHDDDAIL